MENDIQNPMQTNPVGAAPAENPTPAPVVPPMPSDGMEQPMQVPSKRQPSVMLWVGIGIIVTVMIIGGYTLYQSLTPAPEPFAEDMVEEDPAMVVVDELDTIESDLDAISSDLDTIESDLDAISSDLDTIE